MKCSVLNVASVSASPVKYSPTIPLRSALTPNSSADRIRGSPSSSNWTRAVTGAPIHVACTPAGTTMSPNATRKASTSSDTNVDCRSWLISTTNSTFRRCSQDSRGTWKPAGMARSASAAAGVYRHLATDLVPVDGRLEAAHLRPERRHDQDAPDDEEEEAEHGGELARVERVRGLPELGREHQEDDEDQEERQRPRDQRRDVDELVLQLADRPAGDVEQPEPDDDVDRPDPGEDVEGREQDAERVLLDEQRRQDRQERELADVDQVEPRRQPRSASGPGACP